MVVSEKEYKGYSCIMTFIQRLQQDLNRTNRYGIPHRLPLDHSLMVGHVVKIIDLRNFCVGFKQKSLAKTTAKFEPDQEVTPQTAYH